MKDSEYEKRGFMVGIGQSEPAVMGFKPKKRKRGSSVVITMSEGKQYSSEEKLAFAARILKRLETELETIGKENDA